MRATTIFEQNFPKFLIGDSADERTFIVHLHFPQFVGEVKDAGILGCKVEPTFIDPPDGLSGEDIAKLMREAGDFYLSEIEHE